MHVLNVCDEFHVIRQPNRTQSRWWYKLQLPPDLTLAQRGVPPLSPLKFSRRHLASKNLAYHQALTLALSHCHAKMTKHRTSPIWKPLTLIDRCFRRLYPSCEESAISAYTGIPLRRGRCVGWKKQFRRINDVEHGSSINQLDKHRDLLMKKKCTDFIFFLRRVIHRLFRQIHSIPLLWNLNSFVLKMQLYKLLKWCAGFSAFLDLVYILDVYLQ